MELKDKLIELRNNTGLKEIKRAYTQKEFAKKIGIGLSTYKNYELGRIPETSVIKKIKEKCQVSYEYLLDDECENKEENNVNIGKELKLSDKSIQTIKKLNTKESMVFNIFIEDEVIGDLFFKKLYNYKSYKENILMLSKMHKFKDLEEMIVCYSNDKNNKELIELFDYFDSTFENYSGKILLALYYAIGGAVSKDYRNRLDENKLLLIRQYSEFALDELENDSNKIHEAFKLLSYLVDKELRKEIKEGDYTRYTISVLLEEYLNKFGGNFRFYKDIIEEKEITVWLKKQNKLKKEILNNYLRTRKEVKK